MRPSPQPGLDDHEREKVSTILIKPRRTRLSSDEIVYRQCKGTSRVDVKNSRIVRVPGSLSKALAAAEPITTAEKLSIMVDQTS